MELKKRIAELSYRLREPRLFIDIGHRGVLQAWDMVSPTEFSKLYRKVRSKTMCSNARLRSLHRGVKGIIASGVEGDFVECGCASGGSAALIGLAQKAMGANRPLWLFDTFEGLPAPNSSDPDFEIANNYTGTCVGRIEDVKSFFSGLGISDNAHFVRGLFQVTLPATHELRKIALLHIDGDWYDSVTACLETLFDKVSPGGLIQFDDYGYWRGARKAVDEFIASRGISAPLVRIDYSGRILTKTLQVQQ